jgi:hypothetical protein
MKYIGDVLIVLALIGVLLGGWLIPLYIKLNRNEKAIREKEDQIDEVEPRINRATQGLRTESQRVAIIKNEKVPLARELERLKQERKFILEKLPFFKK